MKKTILLLFCILVYSQEVTSQNTFFIGEKTYPCSRTYQLGTSYQLGTPHPKLEILFIKDNEKGLIAVTADDHLGNRRIKGKLIFYLDDNTIITCIDRNKFDVVNNEATTIYNLTKDEISKLKNINISSIRYTIGYVNSQIHSTDYRIQNITEIIKYNYTSSEEMVGSFLKKERLEPYREVSQEKVDFPSVIRELFY